MHSWKGYHITVEASTPEAGLRYINRILVLPVREVGSRTAGTMQRRMVSPSFKVAVFRNHASFNSCQEWGCVSADNINDPKNGVGMTGSEAALHNLL